MLIVTKDRELSATLDGRRVQPKVALLFALMAVRRQRVGAEAAWVSALELANLAGWSASRPESIGKEVSKALKVLGDSATTAIESPRLGKTRLWRLRPEFEQIHFAPDLTAVEEAISAEHMGDTPDQFLAWLAPAVRALVDLHGGRALPAVQNAYAAFNRSGQQGSMVRASSAVLLGRAATRAGCIGEPANAPDRGAEPAETSAVPDSDELLRTLLHHPLWDAIGQHHSLRARISARLDFLLRHDPDRLVADRPGGIAVNLERAFALAHQAAPMAASGDLGTAGVLFNVAGVLANLSGDYNHARVWLVRAIPLLIATGALAELESAVFNLALNMEYAYRSGNRDRDAESASAILELDELLCSSFGFDQETIQTQALLASHAIRKGDLDRAERALDRAQEVLAGIANRGEHGCYHERRAQLMAARILERARRSEPPHARGPHRKATCESSTSRPADLHAELLWHLRSAVECYESDQRIPEAEKLQRIRARARRAGSTPTLLAIAQEICESM